MDSVSCRVEAEERTNAHVLRVSGSVDHESIRTFATAMDEALRGGSPNLVVNLSDATYMCSAAWGQLLAGAKKLQSKAGWIVLAGVPAAMKPVYNMLGLQGVLKAFPDEGEALRFLTA